MSAPLVELGKSLTEIVMARLLETGRCHIPGFGMFRLVPRKSWRVRNPRTGRWQDVPETVEVRFRAARRLKRRAQKSRVAAGKAPPCDNQDQGRVSD